MLFDLQSVRSNWWLIQSLDLALELCRMAERAGMFRGATLDDSPLPRLGAFRRQEMKQFPHRRQQPAPRSKNGMDDAGARAPDRQNVNEQAHFDLPPNHHRRQRYYPPPRSAAPQSAAMSSLTSRGTCGTITAWPSACSSCH